jgi:hypothetical protein
MTLIAPAAQLLECRALKDGLLYVFFLLAFAGFTTALPFVANWFARSFTGRGTSSQKQTAFSKGANR